MSLTKLSIALLSVFLTAQAFAHSGADDLRQIGSIGYGSMGDASTVVPVIRETTSVRFDIDSSDVGRPGHLVLIYQSDRGPMAVLTQNGWKGFVSGLAEPLVNTQSLEPTYSVVFFDVSYPAPDSADISAPEGAAPFKADDYSRFPGVFINARMAEYENASLCVALQRQGFGSGTIYAAYGALQAEAEETIERFHAVKNPKMSPEHLRNVYIEQDGRKGHKYSAVIDLRCSGGRGGIY